MTIKKRTKISPIEYFSVVEFVKSAESAYPQLDMTKQQGFIEYMRAIDKFYMENERGFVPYLRKYLGE